MSFEAIPFDPVAIVAADCLLPDAPDLAAFYANNEAGHCSIRELPAAWWGPEPLYDPNPSARNRSHTRLAALLPPWRIDASKFKLPPKQLQALDPVHALALELARRVVASVEATAPLPREDTAVILANVLGGSHTVAEFGLHFETQKWARRAKALLPEAAAEIDAYEAQVLKRYPNEHEEASINSDSATIAGRICNYFDFRGPHFSIDGAGASSLAALHTACLGLHQGEFRAALVGGVSRLTPEYLVLNSKARTLSATGSFPFDERADGFAAGEGGVFIVLMRLEEALRAGHRVRGVIRSIGYSCNGRTSASTKPSREAEQVAIERAFERLEFGVDGVDYVEADGTGSRLGDEAELGALVATYGRVARGRPLPFGSAKSMVGHLVDGAGLAGVLRALFVFERHLLPPTVNVGHPRDDITLAEHGLALQQAARPLDELPSHRPLRVGVSSFGDGGINYHVLLEDRPADRAPVRRSRIEREPVAVIGVGAVMPDAPDVDTFWRNLVAGRVSSHDLRDYIPMFDSFYEPNAFRPRGTYLDRAARAPDPAFGDYRRFRIPPNRAARLTREQLLLLQATSDLLSRLKNGLAGIDPTRAGCIVGQITDADERGAGMTSIHFGPWYRGLGAALRGRVDPARLAAAGETIWNDASFGFLDLGEDAADAGNGALEACRIASGLDFRGKSFTVRAACSTGLTVVALAINELRQRTLDFVLCGATSFGLDLSNQAILAAIQALSRQGQTRPYDEASDGFIIGSGAVALALKRLSDAERDGDDILAVVREVAGASDGKGTSLLAPNLKGRELVLRRVYERAGVAPASVQYVEGHGAATSIGDETEVESLASVIKNGRPLYLGSVKSNVGHLKAAAGMAALVKTILSLREKTIVPHAGFERPRQALRLEERGIVIPTSPLPWPDNDGEPRRAGISAYGLAGNNYHALVEEYVRPERSPAASARSPEHALLVWSADSRERLLSLLDRRPQGAAEGTGAVRAAILADASTAGQVERRIARLRRHLEDGGDAAQLEPLGIFCREARERPAGKVCFLFPGQGSQYPGMLREGARQLGGLPRLVAETAEALREELPEFAAAFWGDGGAVSARTEDWLTDTAHTQVATLLATRALLDWLGALGVRPDMLLGHSFGEFGALLAADSISYADSVRLAYWRGRIASDSTQGEEHAMAVLFADGPTMARLVAESAGVFVANLNSPTETVVSGGLEAVRAVLARSLERGIEGRLLPVGRAYHTPLLEPAVRPFEERLASVELRPPRLPVYSTLTGEPYPATVDAATIAARLARLYTVRVDFCAAAEHAYAQGARVFVEVGPKRALTGLVGATLGADDLTLIPLLHPKGGEVQHLLRAAARLWVYGLTDTVPGGRPIEQPASAPEQPAPTPEQPARCVALVPEVRTVAAPRPVRSWRGVRALIVGDGSGLGRILAAHLRSAGADVEPVTVLETAVESSLDRVGPALRVGQLRAHLAGREPPDFVFFLPGFDAGSSAGGRLRPRDAARVGGSLAALREIMASCGETWQARRTGGLVVVSRADGRLGHTESARADALGGALLGFARAVHREIAGVLTRAVDVSPLVGVDRAAAAILDAAAAEAAHLELGVFGDEWTSSVLLPVHDAPAELAAGPLPWDETSTVLATGGARGVTSRVLQEMMRAQPCRCVVVGRTEPLEVGAELIALSPDQLQEEKIRRYRELRAAEAHLTPAQFEQRHWLRLEKSIEIARNLAALRASGAEVEYRAVELGRVREARAFGRELLAAGRRVDVVLHGAGIEKSKLVWDALPEEWDATVATKVAGLHNLLELLGPHTRAVLLFGSIAGGFGGEGQTAYAAACEYLARVAYRLAADVPQARVTTITWAAWDNVGLATRSSSRAFLRQQGLEYMPADEGAAWALAALRGIDVPHELVILPRRAPTKLFTTRRVQLRPSAPRPPRWHLADSVVHGEDGGSVVRWRFDPIRDAYLRDHRVGGNVRLPAAHLVEQIAAAVSAARPGEHVVCLEDLRIEHPVVLAEQRPRDLFVEVATAGDGVYDTTVFGYPLLPDGTWVPRRLDIARSRVVTARARPAPARVETARGDPLGIALDRLAGLFGQFGIAYGPHFSGLAGYFEHPAFAYAARVELAVEAAAGGGLRLLDVPFLDVAFQSLAPLLDPREAGLPVGFDRIELVAPPTTSPPRTGWAFGAVGQGDGRGRLTLTLTDDSGSVLARVYGIRLRRPVDVVSSPEPDVACERSTPRR